MDREAFHVFVKAGDAQQEVEAVLNQLGTPSPEAAGHHKTVYVTRANQTAVMVTGPQAPLAQALRVRPGWIEPAQ
jgi:hypothetical protein